MFYTYKKFLLNNLHKQNLTCDQLEVNFKSDDLFRVF